jgi:3-deoxy-D-manno-octulosonic-acid transferase
VVPWLINFAYLSALVVSAPWLVYRFFWLKKNRRGWSQRLWGRVPPTDPTRNCIWLHAVSVGEVQLLGPIVDELLRRDSRLQLVISTTTESGFDVARKRFVNHSVFFCPFDFTWSVKKTLRRLQPKVIVLAELELWPNLLRAAAKQNVPVIVVNGRLSERSFRGYQRISFVARAMLRSVTKIAAQSPEYANRFLALGAYPESIQICGNIKFDGAFNPQHAELGKNLKQAFQVEDSEIVFVAGSTQPEEDVMVAQAYRILKSKYPQLRLVVVPRHMHNVDSLLAILKSHSEHFVRRSQLNELASDALRGQPIIVVDAVGELAGWWSLSKIAYVGGSMGKRGGQNMIEPAANRAVISFGPRTENFRDIVAMLLSRDAACVVHNQQDFEAFLERAIVDAQWRDEMGHRAFAVVQAQQGATARACDMILDLLNPAKRPRSASARRVA